MDTASQKGPHHTGSAPRAKHGKAARFRLGDVERKCPLIHRDTIRSALAKMQRGLTRVVINRDQTNTSEFVRGFAAQARSGNVGASPDPQFPARAMEAQIVDAVGAECAI